MFLYLESVYPIFRDMAYFSINLQTSQYLKPAQQLLDEVVCISNAVEPGLDEEIRKIRSIGVRLPSSGGYLQLGYGMKQHEGDTHQPSEKHIVQIKIDKLEALLHELERRCEQYFNELDRVVSSFEVIAGTGAAAPYTALTIQAMSKHFSNLRDAIIAQIHSSTMTLSKDFPTGPSKFCEHRTMDEGSMHWDSPRSFSCTNKRGRATEREHRGAAIVLLRAWLFEHMLHPYPDANEKIMLASKTGLTILQVSNWFINARCRLWKPLIEELYREELEDDTGVRSS